MTRFLAVGDIHLGAHPDYGRELGDRLRDQENAWRAALELAVDHDVDAVLFAGDAFHHRRPTPAELIAFQRPLQILEDNEIEIVAINGNHDCEAANLPTALEVFGREVILYGQPGVWHGDGGCAVACLPWAPLSRLVAARDGGDRDELHREAAGLLVAAARGLRAQIPAGQPAVLMLHWSISGAVTPTGATSDEFREVVLDLAALEELGFDAVVAGHIHLPEVLNGPFDGGRPIFYVGSPLPVDFGEQASPHGCWLLEVGEGETRATFLPVASRPFLTLDFDHDDVAAQIALSQSVGWDVEDAVVRVRYRTSEEQARRVDQAQLRRSLYDGGAHKVFAIQADIVRQDRARVAGVDEDLAPLSAIDLWIAAERLDGWERDSLRELGARYLEAVAP